MRNQQQRTFVPVTPLWKNATCVCIASGPSLTPADVDYVRDKARVIVVNNGYQLAPWADVLWATDARWWRWHKGAPGFNGLKFSLSVGGLNLPRDVHVLRNAGFSGWSTDPAAVYHGKNGGFCATQLAAHLGASRVILLGYDMQATNNRHHWHGEHPYHMPNPYTSWVRAFRDNAERARSAGLEIVNCTRETALTMFPRMPLEQALPAQRDEAVA